MGKNIQEPLKIKKISKSNYTVIEKYTKWFQTCRRWGREKDYFYLLIFFFDSDRNTLQFMFTSHNPVSPGWGNLQDSWFLFMLIIIIVRFFFFPDIAKHLKFGSQWEGKDSFDW